MEKVKQFLLDMGIAPELTDLDETTDRFMDEMKKGLDGELSSLKMIPSYIGKDFEPVPGESVAVVDAGGTNLRVSEVRFDSDLVPTIERIERFSMPGSREPVESDAFFDELAGHLSGVLERTQKLGFCFSYPVEILPSRDGKIISLSKEVVVKNCEGKIIGEELQKALKKRGAKAFTHIVVLNDTTASLLGGRLFCRDKEYSDYIGLILGTGTNVCYYEQNSNIKKDKGLVNKAGSTIINVESGCFDKLVSGSLDSEFWSKTLAPTEYRMEKMISGQYLGALLLKYLKKGAEYGLFSEKTKAAALGLEHLKTKDIDALFEHPSSQSTIAGLAGDNDADLRMIFQLVDAMFERAARLVVCCYVACQRCAGTGSHPLHPVLITVEGTTYYRCEALKRKIDYYIEHYMTRRCGLYVQTARVEDAVTYGTALAAVCR